MDKTNITSMELEDVNKMYMDIEKKIILQNYTFPTKPSSDNFYHINIKDVSKKSGYRQFKAKDLDTLKEKVYHYEKGIDGTARKTFKTAFCIVEDEKLKYIKDPVRIKSRERTVNRDYSEYKRFFSNTDFENKYLDTITTKDIENICMKNLKQYDLKKKGLESMKAILKSVFDLAYRKYWIPDNIYDRIDFKRYKNMCVESASIKERFHSEKEVERILECIHEKQDSDPKYLPSYALELQIAIGLRRGEVPPLEWDDITQLDGVYQLYISKTLLRDNTPADHTKTDRNRLVPLTPAALDVIVRLRKVHEQYNMNSKYLFPAENANGYITYDTTTDYYYRVIRKLGLKTSKDFMKGTHSFRRNVATDLRNKGFNPQFVANMLGQSVEVQNSNYYTGGFDKNALQLLVNM